MTAGFGLMKDGIRLLVRKNTVRENTVRKYAAAVMSALIAALVVSVSIYAGDEGSEAFSRAQEYMRQGEMYEEENRFGDALNSYINGMMEGEKSGSGVNIMAFYKKIGNIYGRFGDYGRAMNIYEKGYSLRKRYPDRKTECDILFNLVGMCYFTDDVAKARHYYTLARQLVDPRDSVKRFMSVYSEGLVLLLERNPEALERMKKAASTAPNRSYECFAYEKLYRSYREAASPDSCFKYLTLCSRLALENGMTEMYAQTLHDFSTFYKERNDEVKARSYMDRYRELEDSVIESAYDLKKFYKARNTQYLYEIEKTDRRISDLQVQQREKEREIRFQRLLAAILAGVLLMVAVFLWVALRQKKRLSVAYRDLYDRNVEVLKGEADSKSRIAGYEERIRDLEEKIASQPDHTEEEKPVETSKYQASNLNEENRQRIVEALAKAMDEDKAFCSEDFSLGRLAELVGTNQAYLSQVINECHGKNFTEYVNEYRIKEVCNRLLDTAQYGNYTIEAVAESVGFRSRSTFSRTFRKITGIPPSVYQKMSKDQEKEP